MERSSISALASLLQDQKPVIERVRQDTRSIRESRSPQLSLTADADGQASLKSHSLFNSSIGDEVFSFDDEIVNSFAYRNAIKRLASKVKATQQTAKPEQRHILDEPLIDLEEPSESHNGPKIKSNAASNRPCLTPTKKIIHTDLISKEVVEDLKLLQPTSTGSPSQHFAGFSRDGTAKYYTDREDESASGSEGELAIYPLLQTRQSTSASNIHASPRHSTIIPDRSFAQEDVPEVSIDEGSRIPDLDIDSRSSKDHQFTISANNDKIHDKAIALCDYARENVDELSLKEGQIVEIWSHQIQGRLMVENPRTGQLGFVPENLVQLLPDVEGKWITLSGEQPANKERPIDADIPFNINGSCTQVSADKRDTNDDVKEVTGKRVTVDTHQEALNSNKLPSKRMRASAKNGTPSSPREEQTIASKPFVQQVARGSPHVEPLFPRTPISMGGISGINDSNSPRVDLFATTRLRSPVERAAHEGRHDRKGKTKASGDKRVRDVPVIVEYLETNPEVDEKDETSTEKVTYRPGKRSRKEERMFWREPGAGIFSGAHHPAAALDRLPKEHSSSKHDIESSIPKQKHRRRRAIDNSQDSGPDVPLFHDPARERVDRAASISSTSATPRLIASEDAIRRLIIPELETLRQEQKLQRPQFRNTMSKHKQRYLKDSLAAESRSLSKER